MFRRLTIFCLILLTMACKRNDRSEQTGPTAGQVISQSTAAHPIWPRETTLYVCSNGTKLQIAYLRVAEKVPYASIFYGGRLSLMRDWPGVPGIRFVSIDEELGLRWHYTAGEGTLSFLAADHTAEPVVLLQNCKESEPPNAFNGDKARH